MNGEYSLHAGPATPGGRWDALRFPGFKMGLVVGLSWAWGSLLTSREVISSSLHPYPHRVCVCWGAGAGVCERARTGKGLTGPMGGA